MAVAGLADEVGEDEVGEDEVGEDEPVLEGGTLGGAGGLTDPVLTTPVGSPFGLAVAGGVLTAGCDTVAPGAKPPAAGGTVPGR